MYAPSEVMKSVVLKSNSTKPAFSISLFKDYASARLNKIKKNLEISHSDQSNNNGFVQNVLETIKIHQLHKIHFPDNVKITPLLHHSIEKDQLPRKNEKPTDLPQYALDLAKLSKWETTTDNEKRRIKSLNLLHSSIDELPKDLKHSVLKSMILYRLSTHNNSALSLFRKIDVFDIDIYYLILLNYFINPDKLNKFGRVNQLVSLFDIFFDNLEKKYTLSLNDWQILSSIVLNNALSGNNVDVSNHPIFMKTIEAIEGVSQHYNNYNLVKMFITFKHLEYGVELNSVIDTNDQVFVKFNISNYRYLMINQAITELNPHQLTPETWKKYQLSDQWNIIWNLYYENSNISPPGGLACKKKIKSLIDSFTNEE